MEEDNKVPFSRTTRKDIPSMWTASEPVKKRFYEKSLRKFRQDGLEGADGEVLYALLNYRPNKVVISYVRKWLRQFPEEREAPYLAGIWLEIEPTPEAIDIASHYLLNCQDSDVLGPLITGASMVRSSRLSKLLQTHIERDPQNHTWINLQVLSHQTKINVNLTLRLIELNFDNPKFYAHHFVLTRSPAVREKILQWVKKNPTSSGAPRVLFWLLADVHPSYKKIHSKAVPYTRKWLRENQNYEFFGKVLTSLLHVTQSQRDVRAARQWHESHSSYKASFWALVGPLQLYRKLKIRDTYFIEQAKLYLLDQPPEKRESELVHALLTAQPDEEAVTIAKDLANDDWIMNKLLEVAPDDELVATAHRNLAIPPDDGLQFTRADLLVTLLKLDPQDTESIKLARRWIRERRRDKKYSRHHKNDCEKLEKIIRVGKRKRR